MSYVTRLMVKPGTKAALHKRDPDATPGYDSKERGLEDLERNRARLQSLQNVLWAENKHALLIILQAMDAGGKDGAIREVMSGVNPQGCSVHSFKVPSAAELDHDFLWRIHQVIPGKGEIAIFNRSHYEDVIVVRVRNLVPKEIWSRRYDQINAFENLLSWGAQGDFAGVTILKFFLHISREEQRERLLARVQDPDKNWKVNPGDFADHALWDNFQKAYEDAITRCSTPAAPWYVIPANKKWYRNVAISEIIVRALESLKLKMPRPKIDPKKFVLPK